jgi:hypothetical protein
MHASLHTHALRSLIAPGVPLVRAERGNFPGGTHKHVHTQYSTAFAQTHINMADSLTHVRVQTQAYRDEVQ